MTKAISNPSSYFYSRRKLSLYLGFNLLLLFLAFSLAGWLFPDFWPYSQTVILLCLISVVSAAATLLWRRPLAVITSGSITIDFCQPLPWKSVTAARKETVGHLFYKKKILILETGNLENYRYNWIQKAIRNSRFTAFSIPLYAMDTAEARKIYKQILKFVS